MFDLKYYAVLEGKNLSVAYCYSKSVYNAVYIANCIY